ncbi:MAG: CSLREA domain-containing protein, partial [Chloroflexi bacterium]|nr:CSLREA domain-containing protein [Chloroflexota bacterium]
MSLVLTFLLALAAVPSTALAAPAIIPSANLTLGSASTLTAEINGTTVGTQYTQYNVTGTVALNGAALQVTLGYTPAMGNSFIIVNNDGTDAITGTFSGLSEGATLAVSNRALRISYMGGTGNDVTLTAMQPAILVNSALDVINSADNVCTLREAVIAANTNAVSGAGVGECAAGSATDPDTIVLTGTTYTLTIAGDDNTAAAGDLDITQSVNIVGVGAETTIIQACPTNQKTATCTAGQGVADRVFHLLGGTTAISSVTIRNGYTTTDGGGIYNSGATLNLSNCVVSDNRNAGGGVGDFSGGGLYNWDGTVTITGSTFSGNVSVRAGGIGNRGGPMTITNSAITGNSGSDTGGLRNFLAVLTVSNSTISGNTALTFGGIRNATTGTVSLTNTTVAGNSASDVGGIAQDASATAFTLKNTLVANNTGPVTDCAGALTSQGFNLIRNVTGCTGVVNGVSNDITGQDPLLDVLANNGGTTQTQALRAGSPALNAGTNTGCPAADQRGLARTQGASCDIGAFEAGLFTVSSATDAVDDNPGNGVCHTAANQCTLRAAIQESNAFSGAFITFAAGLNGTPITLTIAGDDDAAAVGDLDLLRSVTITGNGAANTIIQACDRNQKTAVCTAAPVGTGVADRVFDMQDGTVSISAVTVRNGRADLGGAGILVFGGALTLTNSTFSGNMGGVGGGVYNPVGAVTLTNSTVSDNMVTQDGGGIYTSTGAATLTNSTVSGNTATQSGGGMVVTGGVVTLTSSTVSGNAAKQGGGFHITTGTVTLTNSTVSGNTVTEDAAGMIVGSGAVTVTNSTISGNTAARTGAGMFITGTGMATVINSAIIGNTATVSVGGMATTGGTTTVINSTVSGNTAPFASGMAVSAGVATLSNSTISGNTATTGTAGLLQNVAGTATLNNTLVAGNLMGGTPNDCDGVLTSAVGHNLIQTITGCTLTGTTTGNVTGQDPKMGTLATNGGVTLTVALLAGSPALDVGDAATCANVATVNNRDQRGLPRPQNG